MKPLFVSVEFHGVHKTITKMRYFSPPSVLEILPDLKTGVCHVWSFFLGDGSVIGVLHLIGSVWSCAVLMEVSLEYCILLVVSEVVPF